MQRLACIVIPDGERCPGGAGGGDRRSGNKWQTETAGEGFRGVEQCAAADANHHRDIARQMGETGVHFTTPMMQLQDPKQTKVLIVTLAETTPVLEAANLQDDLRRAGIEPWAWIVNSSVAAAHPYSPLLRQRARNELREIDAVATQHARRHAVVPLLTEEPVGVERLRALANRKIS